MYTCVAQHISQAIQLIAWAAFGNYCMHKQQWHTVQCAPTNTHLAIFPLCLPLCMDKAICQGASDTSFASIAHTFFVFEVNFATKPYSCGLLIAPFRCKLAIINICILKCLHKFSGLECTRQWILNCPSLWLKICNYTKCFLDIHITFCLWCTMVHVRLETFK